MFAIKMISVVIPSYNHAKFLSQRIDSVLSQTYQNFEVIILDDCSTDNSKAVIEPYRNHPKVSTIIYNEQNSGSTFKQWQKGIALAKGEWIWIAESDDFNHPSFLERAVSSLQKHPEASLFFCHSHKVNEKGELTGDMHWWIDAIKEYNWYESFTDSGQNFSEKALLQLNPISNASGVVFRNSPNVSNCLKKVAAYKMCGDWLFWSLIIQDKQIIYEAEKLNYFRFHDGTTRSNLSHKKTLQRLIEEIAVKEQIRKVYRIQMAGDVAELKKDTLKYANIRNLRYVSELVRSLHVPRSLVYIMKFVKWSVKNRINRDAAVVS